MKDGFTQGVNVMNNVIDHYESLATLTRQMREAVDQGEWDKLVDLEQQCSRHVANIKLAEETAALDDASRQIEIQLIRKILEDDAYIRANTESWMAKMKHVMQSQRQEQRLNQSYGAM